MIVCYIYADLHLGVSFWMPVFFHDAKSLPIDQQMWPANGRMNDQEAWSAGSCKIEPDANSYDQNGFRIFDRSAAYASI